MHTWDCGTCLHIFPGGSDGKESACNIGDSGSILGQEEPSRREWLPTAVFLPGECHGQRNLVSYSPRGCKESDTTEQLALFLSDRCGLRLQLLRGASFAALGFLLPGAERLME